MKWFGSKPWAPVCEFDNRWATPVGVECAWCGESFTADDAGLFIQHLGKGGPRYRPMHRECAMRGITGSVAHLQKRCSCYGGTDDHGATGMTKRDEARLACKIWGASFLP